MGALLPISRGGLLIVPGALRRAGSAGRRGRGPGARHVVAGGRAPARAPRARGALTLHDERDADQCYIYTPATLLYDYAKRGNKGPDCAHTRHG